MKHTIYGFFLTLHTVSVNRRAIRTSSLGLAGAMVLTLTVASGAAADTVYNYTGAMFSSVWDSAVPGTYTTSMRIEGSVTLTDPLAPNLANEDVFGSVLDYSFFDGLRTIAKADLYQPNATFRFSTDASGNIQSSAINFALRDTPGNISANEILSFSIQSFGDQANFSDFSQGFPPLSDGAGNSTPGTWAQSPVPVPPALVLLGSGLAMLTRVRKRNR